MTRLLLLALLALTGCAHRTSTDGQMTNTQAAAIAAQIGKW